MADLGYVQPLLQAGLTQTAQAVALNSVERQNSMQQRAAFYASYWSLFGLTSWLFDGIGGMSSNGALSFSVAQVKELLHEVVSKLEVIIRNCCWTPS